MIDAAEYRKRKGGLAVVVVGGFDGTVDAVDVSGLVDLQEEEFGGFDTDGDGP